MKLIPSILTLYFLGLAFMPCKPDLWVWSDLCRGDQCELLVGAEETPLDDCGDEPCALRCDCTCCANVLNIAELMALGVEVQEDPSSGLSQFHLQIEGILSCLDIWQPPKLS